MTAVAVGVRGPIVQLALISAAAYCSFAFCGWYFALNRNDLPLRAAGFRPVGPRALLAAIPAVIVVILLNIVVLVALGALIGDVPSAREQILGAGAGDISFSDLLWLLLAAAVLAPMVEEFVFRGLLFRYLRGRRGFWLSAVLSALLFAIAHLTPALVPSLFLFGLVLAYMVERYDSLYPAIALHSLNNALAVVVVYLTVR